MTSVEAAVLVLADHTYSYSSMDHGEHCACGWSGPRHVEHQAGALAEAGLLTAGTPPGCTCDHKFSGHADGCPSVDERADRRTT